MSESRSSKVIEALLERLYASLARGPAINCSPGVSRQRLDFAALEGLRTLEPTAILSQLMGPDGKCRLRVQLDKVAAPGPEPERVEEKGPWEERKRQHQIYQEKIRLLNKLAVIADEARTYEQDTGAYILYIGFPLLSIAPSEGSKRNAGRVLAPLCFIPVRVSVGQGGSPFVEFGCAEEGAERVLPNAALKAYLERQCGAAYPELFEDEEGVDPLKEISEHAAFVAKSLQIPQVPDLTGWTVHPVPKTEVLPPRPALLSSAVLGLYRLDFQNTIADLEEMNRAEVLPGTVSPFLSLNESLVEKESIGPPQQDATVAASRNVTVSLADEHPISSADPCQRRAVARARIAKGLVIHGPPGTGKSQTITNIIGDHLARGQKVLLVCEKRTALDVVKYRLERLGLGALCAVVHDASRDRNALYKDLRDQLENLAGSSAETDPKRELGRVVAEMEELTGELRRYFEALAAADDATGGLSFGELAGRWFSAFSQIGRERQIVLDSELGTVAIDQVLQNEGKIRATLERIERASYSDNGWVQVHSLTLDGFLARDMHAVRKGSADVVGLARAAETAHVPGLPGYRTDLDILAQGTARAAAGERLATLTQTVPPSVTGPLAALEPQAHVRAQQDAQSLASFRELLSAGPPDPELRMIVQAAPIPLPQLTSSIAALETYLAKAAGFFGFLFFGVRKNATLALAPLGLTLSLPSAQRALEFLKKVRAQILLRTFLEEKLGPAAAAYGADDTMLVKGMDAVSAVLAYVTEVSSQAELEPLRELIRATLQENGKPAELSALLVRSREEAEAYAALMQALEALHLLSTDALVRFREKLYFGKPLVDDLEKLRTDAERLEELLRFEFEASQFPAPLGRSFTLLAKADFEPDMGWLQLLTGLYAAAMQRRLAQSPLLQRTDAQKLSTAFTRLRELTAIRHQLECQSIRCQWQTRQRTRLLATTGSRLNSDGADLRRRLTLRGRNASRIRQVLQQGRTLPEGDPIFDLKPIWMASPETASQIFPLEPIFDIVIFDEASQCRLEHGLSVLARGHRACVAGDTKQLPPTRFFDTAVTSSADAATGEDDSESLFISQQAEIEDLLGAALNIEVEQSFLDVHYRSHSSDLIEFSNSAFYGSRLQAIPGHPNNRADEPSVQLHNANGTYTDRMNEKEAEYVVQLVKGLLRRESPPSIGIVSFNLQQKDLITRKLDQEAESDAEFRAALAASRSRQGNSSFEGLFVKNLENVQGDERDHIIISTTYGPDPQGKFYRRFGPLGQSGGERRLNVIITRARVQVDLVTSIPPAIYRAEVQVPEGKRPNGSWFLMSYLRFAEELRELYASEREQREEIERVESQLPATVKRYTNPVAPSTLAEAVATHLCDNQRISSALYYGTEGFCMDLALQHPVRTRNVTLGLLFDTTRYSRAEDAVEWEAFQTMVLESQNWTMHRIWSPHFFRDPEGMLTQILQGHSDLCSLTAEEHGAAEPEKS